MDNKDKSNLILAGAAVIIGAYALTRPSGGSGGGSSGTSLTYPDMPDYNINFPEIPAITLPGQGETKNEEVFTETYYPTKKETRVPGLVPTGTTYKTYYGGLSPSQISQYTSGANVPVTNVPVTKKEKNVWALDPVDRPPAKTSEEQFGAFGGLGNLILNPISAIGSGIFSGLGKIFGG